MPHREQAELFLKRVVAVQHVMDEVSFGDVIEILAYVLGSIVAKAPPDQRAALRRLIGRRISRAALFHISGGMAGHRMQPADRRTSRRDSEIMHRRRTIRYS